MTVQPSVIAVCFVCGILDIQSSRSMTILMSLSNHMFISKLSDWYTIYVERKEE